MAKQPDQTSVSGFVGGWVGFKTNRLTIDKHESVVSSKVDSRYIHFQNILDPDKLSPYKAI